MNNLNELRSKPLALLTVEEFLKLQEQTIDSKIQPEVKNEIIDIDEVVKITGYKKNTIYSKTSNRTIPFHKRGNKIIFKRSEIEEWLLENRKLTIQEQVAEIEKRTFLKRQKA